MTTDTTLVYYGLDSWSEVWEAVVSEYGDQCAYCTKPWEAEGKLSRTIDHYHSKHYGKRNGWTFEQINGVANLRPAHKICNAVKSNREWVDGELSPKPRVREEKVPHTPVCQTCESGRILLHGETCPDCGSGPQPSTAPKYLQVSPKECSHGWGENPEYYCWMCYIGHVERRPAVDSILEG